MSAADEAWETWAAPTYAEAKSPKAAFMAGYRRALEDAADAWYDGDTDNETIVSEWLRELAAAVAPDPRETKD